MSKGCNGCTERYVGCHDTCETYLEYKAELEKKNKAYRSAKQKEWDYDGFRITNRRKAKRNKGKRA